MRLSAIIRQAYKSSFENKCFHLIINAYNICKKSNAVQLDFMENDISQVLCEKMEVDEKRLTWGIHISREHHQADNQPKSKGFADKLKRIDFRMVTLSNAQEFKYYLEAKRLKENDNALKKAYITNGIDRFTTETYPLGTMLGYLLEGNVTNTIQDINSRLKIDKRNSEALNANTHAFVDNYYESTHNVGTIKHLILNFTY